jgi:ankyrin repeat protein
VNGRDACGWTPLHFAVMGAWPLHESHVSTASLLLELKADVNAPECTQHWAPVHVATDAVAVELLMDNGADVRSRDSAGQSVMHMCAPEVARALLDKLPREQWMPLVEARDAQDRVPLHVASSPAKVSVLASACPSSINAVDKSGRTPLDLALSSDRHDVAQELACAYGAVRGKKVKTKERSASHTMLYITSGVMLVVAVGILVGRYAPRGGNYIR